MNIRILSCCIVLSIGVCRIAAQTPTSTSVENGFLIEYLRMVGRELEQFQSCPDCTADRYHYLRPVTDIRGGLVWVTQPFYPEAYGIDAPQENPVLAYMEEQLLSTEHPKDKSLLYLIETPGQLRTLKRLIQLYSLP